MGILEVILGALGSNAFGSIIGWVGGWLNKREDIKKYKLDIEDKKLDRAHEITNRKFDLAVMDREIAGRKEIALVEKEGKETEAQLAALSESYRHDAGLKGAAWVENIRAAIRPFLTIWGATVGSIQTAVIIYIAFSVYHVKFTDPQMYELVKYAMQWVFFQSGLCIGWWFANRSAKLPEAPRL